MSDIYKLQYDGMTLAYPGWNGYVCYEKPAGYPITYLSDEHVSVTGDDLYIPGSEGLQLQSSYDQYYRIDYEITNGEIVDGLLVPSGPCTVYAKDKINYFTATGNFEKGSNVSISKYDATGTTNVPAKYALYVGHTGDIPSSWYETSNRWKPSNASAYYITLDVKMNLTGTGSGYQAVGGYMAGNAYATGVCLVGTTASNSQSWSCGGKPASTRTFNGKYSKTVNSTVQDVNYGLSAKLSVNAKKDYNKHQAATATYVAAGTTGTWTATGIAP